MWFSSEGTSTAERQEEECEEKISRRELFFSKHYFKSWSNIWTWQPFSQTGSSWQSEYTESGIRKATIEASSECWCPPWQWQSGIHNNEAGKTATKTGYVSPFFHRLYLALIVSHRGEAFICKICSVTFLLHSVVKYIESWIAFIVFGRMTIQMTCSYALMCWLFNLVHGLWFSSIEMSYIFVITYLATLRCMPRKFSWFRASLGPILCSIRLCPVWWVILWCYKRIHEYGVLTSIFQFIYNPLRCHLRSYCCK